MGYLHIENLKFDSAIMLFKECYASEKIHGSSAHAAFKRPAAPHVSFFSGGVKHENFVKLFDEAALDAAFQTLGADEVIVYGEAYGGKCQGMSATYGKQLRFCAFDVLVGERWLDQPAAAQIVKDVLHLDFVPYRKVLMTEAALDAERARPSEVAGLYCGVEGEHAREGIVLRPIYEMVSARGRVIAKYKNDKFKERAHEPHPFSPEAEAKLNGAAAFAAEWVTPMRLSHVVDRLRAEVQRDLTKNDTGRLLSMMVEDVARESGAGELDKDARRAVSSKAMELLKLRR